MSNVYGRIEDFDHFEDEETGDWLMEEETFSDGYDPDEDNPCGCCCCSGDCAETEYEEDGFNGE